MGCCGSKPEEGSSNASNGGGAKPDAKPSQATQQKDKSDNRKFEEAMKFIQKVPLFKRLPKSEHPVLTAALELKKFAKDDMIITQGEPGDSFYVIKEGEAIVKVKQEDGHETQVATLVGGDYFGEGALLKNEPRSASIIASTSVTAFTITRAKFIELELNDKLWFAKRQAVGGAINLEAKEKEVERGPTTKTAAEEKLIADAIQSNKNLSALVKIEEAQVKQIVEKAWKKNVSKGTEIIKQGDLHADNFYIVQDGEFEFLMDKPAEAKSEKTAARGYSEQRVGTTKKGWSFGELALLYHAPRAATVKATMDSVVWVIERSAFKDILMKKHDLKLKEYAAVLDELELLDVLLKEEKRALADALVEMRFMKDEEIISQGQTGDTFYILYDGTVTVLKDKKKVTDLQAQAKKKKSAKFFGEQALLKNEPRAATVKVSSESATVLALDRDSFNMILGPLEDILKESRNSGRATKVSKPGEQRGPGGSVQLSDVNLKTNYYRKDLKRLGLLGCGGFGAVTLEKHEPTGQTFAMKALSKGFLLKMGMQESVMNEKSILLMTDSPFIIKCYATYNGSEHLYFLLQAALGGELFATYHRKNLHGSEKHAKFYSASVFKAFEHLHERRIIYRDLKPENVLLEEKGYVLLTDMGLAKFVVGRTYTTCGTPDYFAPEVIASTGHTKAVDWWTLGILIFELMSGHPPFESSDPMHTYKKVMKGIESVKMPSSSFPNQDVINIIQNLCKKDPSERLALRPGGTKNVQNHKWYADMNWDDLISRKITPPYQPKVKSATDFSNFHAHEEDLPPQIHYVDPKTGWDKAFATST